MNPHPINPVPMPRPSAFGKTLAVSRQVVLKSGQRPGTHASKKRSTRPLASTIAFFRMWLTIASVCWTVGRAGRPPHHPCIERGRLLVSGMITPPPPRPGRLSKKKTSHPSRSAKDIASNPEVWHPFRCALPSASLAAFQVARHRTITTLTIARDIQS